MNSRYEFTNFRKGKGKIFWPAGGSREPTRCSTALSLLSQCHVRPPSMLNKNRVGIIWEKPTADIQHKTRNLYDEMKAVKFIVAEHDLIIWGLWVTDRVLLHFDLLTQHFHRSLDPHHQRLSAQSHHFPQCSEVSMAILAVSPLSAQTTLQIHCQWP